MTDEEAEANALADPDNPPMTQEQLRGPPDAAGQGHPPAFGLTQEEFAARYQIPAQHPARLGTGTLRARPDGVCHQARWHG
ncbi:hypothetical protein AAIH46_20850 [Rhizobium sp. 0TCS1.26]